MIKDMEDVMSSNVGEPELGNMALQAGDPNDLDNICAKVGVIDETENGINVGAGELEGNLITMEITDNDDVGKPTEEDTSMQSEESENTEVGLPDEDSSDLPFGEPVAENNSGGTKYNQHENEVLLVIESNDKDLDTAEANTILTEKKGETTDVLRESETNIHNASKKRPHKTMRPLKNHMVIKKTRVTEVLGKADPTKTNTEDTGALVMADSKLNTVGSKRRIKDTKMSPLSKCPSRPKEETHHRTPLHGALKGGISGFEFDNRTVEDLSSHEDELNNPGALKGGTSDCESDNRTVEDLSSHEDELNIPYCNLKKLFLFLLLSLSFSSSECKPTPAKWQRFSFESEVDLTNSSLSIRRGVMDICERRPPCSGQLFHCTGDSFSVLTNEHTVHLYTHEPDTEGLFMECGQSVNQLIIHPSNIEPQSIDVVNFIRDYYRKNEVTTAATVDPVLAATSRAVVGREVSLRLLVLLCAMVFMVCVILRL
ncbi:uncharacterized protein LOC134965852 isoform X2 [Pseudophryne corroboree]|uniref:uncharacterized protein LOC134965852 isoform X2 n=1 Tax=Pseudophryne corroboree TaxID=495146 RepID=UPI0030819D15